MLKRVIKLLFLLIFTSCELFSPQTSDSKNNLRVLGAVVDYTSVTTYPIFPDCKNYAEDDNRKECFETSITQKLSELLSKNELKVKHEVNDKISIDILIGLTDRASLVNVNSPQIVKKELPNLEQIIRESINALPSIEAARKNGIPVKSQYRMNIIIEML